MTPAFWVTYAVLLLLAGAWVFFLYRRRELRVPGRGLLGGLRFAALAVLLFLLLDPRLSTSGVPGSDGGSWVLVDRSLSMEARAGEATQATRALERAAALGAEQDRILFFGDRVRPPGDPADTTADHRSLLAPALERAAESGARTVHVVGDLRVEDAAAARAIARRTGIRVVTEDVGASPSNAGIAELDLPTGIDAGEPVTVEVTVAGTGSGGDSLTLEIREEDRLVASRRMARPGAGRFDRVGVELPPPSGDGVVRYTARIRLEGDAFPHDDERVAYTEVDPEEGNLVLVSTAADWEPRFLLPVLGRVTGLPTRGYLRVGGDRYLTMDETGGTGTVRGDVVRRQLEGAELVVAHGVDSDAPPWLRQGADRARRAIIFPASAAGARAFGVETGERRSGEWYVSPDLPASPLARELAGVTLQGLAPFTTLLPTTGAVESVPLRAELRGTGRAEPVLVLTTGAGSARRAVVLADGLWRWAFRTEESREVYRRLWAGVAGWLLADPTLARTSGVRPVSRVIGRGEPLRWSAPALADSTLWVRVLRGDSAVVVDTLLTVSPTGSAEMAAPPPGSYRYQVGGPAVEPADRDEGRLDVESFSGDLLHPRAADLEMEAPAGERARAAGAADRPLRTHPLPWLLVLGLLCAEWIGRRRVGLR